MDGSLTCFSGAVKSNIGHLEGASGVASIIKTIMILEAGVIPPNANFERLNPDIDAEFLRIKVRIGHGNIPKPQCCANVSTRSLYTILLGQAPEFAGLPYPHSDLAGQTVTQSLMMHVTSCASEALVENIQQHSQPLRLSVWSDCWNH